MLLIDSLAQTSPEFFPSIQPIGPYMPDVLWTFHVPVVLKLLWVIVRKKIGKIMNMVGFEATEIGFPLPGRSAKPEQPILQDRKDYLSDFSGTLHGNHLSGSSR